MTKAEIISDLLYEARRRLEDLDEVADLEADRTTWDAYVRQQLGEGDDLAQYNAGNAGGSLTSITDPEQRLTFARDLYLKDRERLTSIRRNMPQG